MTTLQRFSWPSIGLHWLLVVSYLGLFGLGAWMVTLGYYDPLYTPLPHLHKSLGVLLMLVLPCHVFWRLVMPRPLPLPTMRRGEMLAAALAHAGLLAGTALVLVTGYLIPTADGTGIEVFDWFTLPAIITSIPQQEDRAGELHRYLAYAVLVLAALHAAAALKHHFVDRDATLLRMLGMTRRSSR